MKRKKSVVRKSIRGGGGVGRTVRPNKQEGGL